MAIEDQKSISPSLQSLMSKLWRLMSRRRRVQLGALLLVMLSSSGAEVFSLAAVFPFLSVLANPAKIWQLPLVQQLAPLLSISSQSQLLLPVSLLFCLGAILAAAVKLLNSWLNGRLAAAIGSDLSCEAYRRTLYQPYGVHVARNSSSVITALQSQVNLIINGINAFLSLLTSGFVLLGLVLALLWIDGKVALISGGVLAFLYWITLQLSKDQIARNSKNVAMLTQKSLQALQEGLGAIRDVLLDGSQLVYLNIYRQSDRPLRRIQAQIDFIGIFPRHIMEALGLCVIAGVAYILSSRHGELISILPLIGALALGAQRILPASQQMYNCWVSIKAKKSAFEAVVEILEKPLPVGFDFLCKVPFDFKSQIRFEEVYFSYENHAKPILKGLSFEIKKGERIGLIGGTGSGKSTTINLLMGLLNPDSGMITVDGQTINCEQNSDRLFSWRYAISHVPQMIYLADRSIAENIAFGVAPEQVDLPRVRLAAQQAQIAEYIESTPSGYGTFVGERGMRLSGGQRQRIGIARALYKEASILVLDEATSSLDVNTEASLMEAIEALSRNLTIVIIAHRISTLAGCDRVIELNNGTIGRIINPKYI